LESLCGHPELNLNQQPSAQGEVRHHYPLAIRDASVATAIGLFLKTLPYALVRFVILIAVTFVTIVWGILTFGGAAWIGDKVHGLFGLVWFAGGSGIFGYLWHAIIRYFLYMIKCGHIAVLTELITHGEIGNGSEDMFSYGKRIIIEKFAQVNALFAIDALVDGVIAAFNNTLDWIGSLLPVPALESLVKLVKGILFQTTTYIDETIFSYSLARGETNPWLGAQDGIIYYCQNVKDILKTAIYVVILDVVFSAMLWGVFLAPALLLVWLTTSRIIGGAALVASVMCAANARSAFLEPLFLIMVMIRFHVAVENQPINQDWDVQLSGLNSSFCEIKEHAAAWMSAPANQTVTGAESASGSL